ncbi:MAG: ComF family protein [Ruminococcaceae bacterium]|nr:ComF family protein [Oscillospiraceae bacterium]
MGFSHTVHRLLHPPRCCSCNRFLELSPWKGEEAPLFCDSCRQRLEREQLTQCPQCFAALCDCTCQPAVMRQRGAVSHRKLGPYLMQGEGKGAIAGLVTQLKRHPRERVIRAAADALEPILREELSALQAKTPISHTVITFLPRSRRNVCLYGFDQARALAAELARRTGYPMLPLLRRKRDGKQQKLLTVKERRRNLRGAFSLIGDPKGLRVVLVDDLVTTGVGMAEGVALLRRGKAAEVTCLSLAVTPKKKPSGHAAF